MQAYADPRGQRNVSPDSGTARMQAQNPVSGFGDASAEPVRSLEAGCREGRESRVQNSSHSNSLAGEGIVSPGPLRTAFVSFVATSSQPEQASKSLRFWLRFYGDKTRQNATKCVNLRKWRLAITCCNQRASDGFGLRRSGASQAGRRASREGCLAHEPTRSSRRGHPDGQESWLVVLQPG